MTLASRIAANARAGAADPARDVVRVRVLASLAAMLGIQTESTIVERAFRGDTGAGSLAFRLTARMHARTQDDFYPEGRVHAGAVVIPAALASDAPDLLSAVAGGYQAASIVAEAYVTEAQRRGYRPTGIFGPIGSAASAAIASGADDETLAHAIGISAAMSAGHNQAWVDGSDEWLYEVAAATRAGVDAHRLAASGARAAAGAFEGGAGWAAAYFDDPGASKLAAVAADTTARTARSAIKLYPVSGISQMPTHLASEIGRTVGFGQIRKVAVRMPADELSYPGSSNRGPFQSRSDSLMSVPRCVAIGLQTGRAPYASLVAASDAEQQALIDLVELVPEEQFADGTCEIVVTTDSGQEHHRAASADQLLFPSWDELTGDLEALARRSECPPEAVKRLATILAGDPGAAEIMEILGQDGPA